MTVLLALLLPLFSSTAGFAHARDGGTILVWAEPSIEVTMAIEPWNWLAGRFLFWEVPEREDAHVVVTRHYQTYVRAFPSYAEPYESCSITLSNSVYLSHELGHCLGFADSVQERYYGLPGWYNPRVCDNPGHPAYSSYRGIMSYCYDGLGPDDDKLIEVYR